MSVIGYDAIHANVSHIPLDAAVVFGYVTGTPDIKWTASDFARFTRARKVTIDQGGHGSPVLTADVRDVETGAWTPETAVRETSGWNVPRRTIYCNQSTLPRVLQAGWRGDIWLARIQPQIPVVPPNVPGCRVVAQQYRFEVTRDISVVFDPVWPLAKKGGKTLAFAEPGSLRETASVSLTWDTVPPDNGKKPSGYTVVFYGLDGKEYGRATTKSTSVTITGLHKNWTYNVHVWANGGKDAPPHASLQVHT